MKQVRVAQELLLRRGRAGLVSLSVSLTACGGGGSGAPEYTDDVTDLVGDPPSGAGGEGGASADGSSAREVPPPIETCPSDDPCPFEGGVTWRCQKRFVYGVNWAWDRFGNDFGGNEGWDIGGVAAAPLAYSTKMAEMKAHGVNVVRWWMFPDFRGDAVTFDDQGVPTGLGGTVLDDITRALELAQIHDLYLMLTLFSFDGFRPEEGAKYMTPLVLDPIKRKALMDSVVRPIAAHVEESEHGIRMHSWDLINEPEWAMIGESIHGDPDYLENDLETEPVSHADMDVFLKEVQDTLRAESNALISVGTTLKWPHSWDNLDVDFHQLHYYPWLEPLFPLDVTPAELGLSDKPVVLGEFPLADEYADGSKYTYAEMMALLMDNGWAGAMGWDWNQATLSNKDEVLAFAEQNSCETAY